jgi:D-inositol-3-phosphate glycosyltransferase
MTAPYPPAAPPRMLRVGLISEHASPLAAIGGVDSGGQNIYVDQVARHLVAQGHAVDVFTRRDDPALPEVVEPVPGLRVIHVDAGPACFVPKEKLLAHMPEFARHCGPWFAGRGYDVVHANFFMSGWVGLRLKRRFGVPLVVTFHALGLVRREHQREADAFPPERIRIERALVAEADRIVAECPQDKVDLARLYGADPAALAMVPCGFDAGEFSPMDRAVARKQLGIPRGEFMVLQLGRMVPRKGIETVIRAMAVLPAGIPARLRIVGGDCELPDEQRTPEIARLRSVARECGVHDRVQFEGCRPRDALRAWYAASDVFVTTPWYEPFGITPLEAMACARPVVGSAVGGIQYTVEDGLTGLLVPPKDPALLAQRLLTLHAEPLRAAAMGQAGLERVQRMFTWEQVARRLAAVYAGAAQPRERVPVGFYVATGAEQAPAALPASAPRRPLQPAVFIDKDGTLVHDVPYNVDPRRLRYTPRAFEGLAALRRAGYRLVMVTNQPGLAQGRFDRPALARLHAALAATGRARGAPFDGFYACGHAPAADGRPQCACRKPAPGLLLHAAQALDIDLARSWMVGDILDDIEAGRRAGCRTVLIDNGNETLWQMSPLRQPDHRCPDLAAAAQAILAHRDPAQPAGEPLPAGAALPVLLNAPPSSQATMGARAAA